MATQYIVGSLRCLRVIIFTISFLALGHVLILSLFVQDRNPAAAGTAQTARAPTDIQSISWINKLQNKHNNKSIHCSWKTFNYLSSIARQLNTTYDTGKFNKNGISTQYISDHFVNDDQLLLNKTKRSQYLRLKSINGTLYLSKH
eukprot:591201_1